MQARIIPDVVDGQIIHGLPATATALEAANRMVEHHIAAILVLDGQGHLQGIVTERDITRRIVSAGRDPRATPLGEIMTPRPDTLAPDDTARDALELMRIRGIRHLPVVDDEGRVMGMVSVRDLYGAMQRVLEAELHETEAFVFGERYGT